MTIPVTEVIHAIVISIYLLTLETRIAKLFTHWAGSWSSNNVRIGVLFHERSREWGCHWYWRLSCVWSVNQCSLNRFVDNMVTWTSKPITSNYTLVWLRSSWIWYIASITCLACTVDCLHMDSEITNIMRTVIIMLSSFVEWTGLATSIFRIYSWPFVTGFKGVCVLDHQDTGGQEQLMNSLH